MVYIVVIPREFVGKRYVCAGSLVNRLFVLTAAHCICQNGHLCEPAGPPGSRRRHQEVLRFKPDLQGSVNRWIKVAIGEALAGTLTAMTSKFEAVEVKVHPGFDTVGRHDIALIRVQPAVEFRGPLRHSGHQVHPICLDRPPAIDVDVVVGEDQPSPNQPVFVAGWGQTFDSQCTTDARGPAARQRCQLPFKATVPGTAEEVTYPFCTFSPNPSSVDQRCQEFYQQATRGLLSPPPTYPVRLLFEGEVRNLTSVVCYDDNPGKFGWCKTSLNDWGWCEAHCMFKLVGDGAPSDPCVSVVGQRPFLNDLC